MVHGDGSARVQTVRPATNPGLWKLSVIYGDGGKWHIYGDVLP
ncbi:hypothetical protein ACH4E7_00350 [Kitasatospora sp. NPDC018058]